MKSGTAEQEQNCVGIPRRAAITLPTPSDRPATHFFTFCGVIFVRTMPTAKTITARRSVTLIES
ncbi:MAG: hypothetical protein Q7U51_11640 [Methanoregula sp.]|nr:hypothetical protein [Methanoregula sp.]